MTGTVTGPAGIAHRHLAMGACVQAAAKMAGVGVGENGVTGSRHSHEWAERPTGGRHGVCGARLVGKMAEMAGMARWQVERRARRKRRSKEPGEYGADKEREKKTTH